MINSLLSSEHDGMRIASHSEQCHLQVKVFAQVPPTAVPRLRSVMSSVDLQPPTAVPLF